MGPRRQRFRIFGQETWPAGSIKAGRQESVAGLPPGPIVGAPMGGVAERPTRREGAGPVRAASTAAAALQSRRTARRVSSCPAGEADRGGGAPPIRQVSACPPTTQPGLTGYHPEQQPLPDMPHVMREKEAPREPKGRGVPGQPQPARDGLASVAIRRAGTEGSAAEEAKHGEDGRQEGKPR